MVMLEHVETDNEIRNSEPGSPLILRKLVNEPQTADSASSRRTLRLAMLGCEDDPPYGPTEHTGQLLLELVGQTLAECSATSESWLVTIAVYKAKQGEYPDDWDAYDGILVPGSLSAAYDNEPWIEKLKRVIQDEIVAHSRPTMGICFGHQILAHSFEQEQPQGQRGLAQKYPKGSRAGRYAMKTTESGAALFGGTSQLNMYYSHGDMVQKLPACAVPLGQEGDELPVQSAAYFKTEADAQAFQSSPSSSSIKPKPYAITFQAHPEYSVTRELGLEFTLGRILNLMEEKELIQPEFRKAAGEDANDTFDTVHRQSKDAFIASARALGWFP